MSGPKRTQDMEIPKASAREIRLLWAKTHDLEQQIIQQVAPTLDTKITEQSLIHDSIGM